MTSCKNIGKQESKKTQFEVVIDITDYAEDRDVMVEYLRNYRKSGGAWMEELADILEKG